MSHPIRQVLQGKKELCRSVLESLPDWFGIPRAIDDYVAEVGALPVFAVGADGRDAGFVALRESFEHACEIYVMGVMPALHRRGMGRALMQAATDFATSHGYRVLYVKTLGPSRESEHYAATRMFYEATGFVALEELEGVWGQGNPCLIMVKPLGSSSASVAL